MLQTIQRFLLPPVLGVVQFLLVASVAISRTFEHFNLRSGREIIQTYRRERQQKSIAQIYHL